MVLTIKLNSYLLNEKKKKKNTELVTDSSRHPRDLLFILDDGPSPQSAPGRTITWEPDLGAQSAIRTHLATQETQETQV